MVWLVSLVAFPLAYRALLFANSLPARAAYARRLAPGTDLSVAFAYGEGQMDGFALLVGACHGAALLALLPWLRPARPGVVLAAAAAAAVLSAGISKGLAVLAFGGSLWVSAYGPTMLVTAAVLAVVSARWGRS